MRLLRNLIVIAAGCLLAYLLMSWALNDWFQRAGA